MKLIGTTTLKAYCNDNEGFAIYAIGYTDETDGKNVLASSTLGTDYDIMTGTLTSGNSQWAMKLATDSGGTYPIILQNSYDSYHNVPTEYELVAKRTSGTDVGVDAIGSTLTTTYQVYASATQPADTYEGKVKYVMVHPADNDVLLTCNENASTISEVKCMQDFGKVSDANRTAIMNSMVLERQYTLKDNRDGKTYTVAKLADGNVWMTQNLDLDLDADTTYTNLDTDIGYNTSTGTYGAAAWRPTRSTYATAPDHLHAWCQGGTWDSDNYSCENNDTPESYDAGDLYWNGTSWPLNQADCIAANGVWDDDWCSGVVVTDSTGAPQYHLGNYYNWAAAVATNDGSMFGSQSRSELVEQSICPVGWTLPRSNRREDTFLALWEAYGFDDDESVSISTLWSSPLYFPMSGFFTGGLYNIGFDGIFWSSVTAGPTDAEGAAFYATNNVYPSNEYGRGDGYSLRCMARPVLGAT